MILFVLFIGALVLLLIVRLVLRLRDFNRELKYVKAEIKRTRGDERKYWKKKKLHLWLSLIPFYIK